MGKKKSKSQKQRQSKKRQLKKLNNPKTNNTIGKKIVPKEEVIYNVILTKPEIYNKKEKRVKNRFLKILDKIESILPKREVTLKKVKKKTNKKKINIKETIKKEKKGKIISNNKINNNIVKSIVEDEIILPKLAKKQYKILNPNSKNILFRCFSKIIINAHIIFNSFLILTFILLLIGLIRINELSSGTIIYISLLVLFLNIIAISHNKHISGKIFSIILLAGMATSIYYLNYTYDFIKSLNSTKYEYKNYYVVTFNTNINKSIYNINNKKVGLLTDNSTNIERMLNTKLDKVEYLEYDDINSMFENFYDRQCRAVIVNDNGYKYLVNNEAAGAKSVKILYEFRVNSLK